MNQSKRSFLMSIVTLIGGLLLGCGRKKQDQPSWTSATDVRVRPAHKFVIVYPLMPKVRPDRSNYEVARQLLEACELREQAYYNHDLVWGLLECKTLGAGWQIQRYYV